MNVFTVISALGLHYLHPLYIICCVNPLNTNQWWRANINMCNYNMLLLFQLLCDLLLQHQGHNQQIFPNKDAAHQSVYFVLFRSSEGFLGRRVTRLRERERLRVKCPFAQHAPVFSLHLPPC